jgi:hypothetical protein
MNPKNAQISHFLRRFFPHFLIPIKAAVQEVGATKEANVLEEELALPREQRASAGIWEACWDSSSASS